MKQPTAGFTLIELMVVIAVIGILSAIALLSFTGIQKQARDAQRKSDLHAYSVALQQFYNANGYYPGATASGCTRNNCGDSIYTNWTSVSYPNSIFSDPSNSNPLVPGSLPKVLPPPTIPVINNLITTYWFCIYPPFLAGGTTPAQGSCIYNYRANADRGGKASTFVLEATLETRPPGFTNYDGAMFYIKYDGETGISKDFVLTP